MRLDILFDVPPFAKRTKQEEYDLFHRAKGGDIEARDALIFGAIRAAPWIVKNVDARMDKEDLTFDLVAHLCKIWHQFDPSYDCRFMTFVMVALRRRMAYLIERETERRIHATSLDAVDGADVPEFREEHDPARHELPPNVIKALTCLYPRYREIVMMYYGLNGHPPMSFREIGAKLGISYQRIAAIVRVAHNRIKAKVG